MKIYNKLVRDKIPQIIEMSKKKSNIRYLDNDEYLLELNNKLQEEINEYLLENNAEELADIQEVILAIIKAKNIDIENIRLKKKAERGGFENKIFLESVED